MTIKKLIILSILLLLFSCNSLYAGKIKIDVSNLKKKEYIKKNPYDFLPDYYFEGKNKLKNVKLSVTYLEHPDGFYTKNILEKMAQEDSLLELQTINNTLFVKKKNSIETSLITGFKKGYIHFLLKGNKKELEKIYNTIKLN